MDADFFTSPAKNQMDLMAGMMEMEMAKLNNEPLRPSLQPPLLGGAVLSPEFFNAAAASAAAAASSSSLAGMMNCPSTGGELSFGGISEGGCRRAAPSVAAMREMIFRMAALQPIRIDPVSVRPPKRRNVKISKDPQSVAARHRRERISERIRILQQLVPGGTKMDTASMLDEAIHYMKFLKNQVQSLERAATSATGGHCTPTAAAGGGFSALGARFLHGGYSCFDRNYEAVQDQVFHMKNSSDVKSK